MIQQITSPPPPLPLLLFPLPGELCPLVVQSSVVKVFRNFVDQMSDHDELLQSVCWTVFCVAFATDGEWQVWGGKWEVKVLLGSIL